MSSNPSTWRDSLAPRGSRRRRILRAGLRMLRNDPGRLRRGLRKPRAPRWIFTPAYTLQDNSQVTLYTDHPDLLPNYHLRRGLDPSGGGYPSVTLIATGLNEKENIGAWLASLEKQSHPPDEVILVDGGSTDGTLEDLREYARHSPLPVQVLSRPKLNIAEGRNVAIREARHPVIACTDFGCRLRTDWLKNILTPFAADAATQVVGGWFEAQAAGRPIRRVGWANLEDLKPQEYLPSSRSMAYRKDAWEFVGGYPEWLTLTGEDTYFSAELKRSAFHWAFVPDAMVDWEAPTSPSAYWQKLHAWSVGDGESGAFTQYAWWSFVRLVSVAILTASVAIVAFAAWRFEWISPAAALGVTALGLLGAVLAVYRGMFRMLHSVNDLVWELGAELPRLAGFLKGWLRRSQVDARRYEAARGVLFLLAVIPIDDTGGGARSAQLAMEFIRQGFVVVYLNIFPKYESVALDLVIRHPNLITRPMDDFDLHRFSQQHPTLLLNRFLSAIVELPAPAFRPLIEALKKRNAVVIYDLLDDWDTSLGADWYDQDVESVFIDLSDVLVGTAPNLVDRLKASSGRPVSLLPNAVNHLLFTPAGSYPRPADFPAGDWSMIYIGALWGAWFDWDLLIRLAEENPEAAVVVIGDYVGQCPDPPPNLHFLGLKPQGDLPAYLAHAQVAVVPWKINAITQATSPLKVYEYLAMHRPVVAPALEPLRGLPGVHLAHDHQEFLQMVRVARHAEFPVADVRAFIQENTWEARANAILALAQEAAARAKLQPQSA